MTAGDWPGGDPTTDHRPFTEGEEVEVTLTVQARVKGRMTNVSADGAHADLEAEPWTEDTEYAIVDTVIHRLEP